MIKFQLGALHHVGFVVPDLKAALAFYRIKLDINDVSELFILPERGLKIRFVNFPTGRIELIEPEKERSSLYGFLQHNPHGGQHHICFEVNDMEDALSHIKVNEVRLLSEPFMGILGSPIVFLNPEDTNGLLIELMETPLIDP